MLPDSEQFDLVYTGIVQQNSAQLWKILFDSSSECPTFDNNFEHTNAYFSIDAQAVS